MNCTACTEPIVAGDRMSPAVVHDEQGHPGRAHMECSLRVVVGGIEHLTASKGHEVGTCYDEWIARGNGELTYRESSVLATRWIEEHGIDAALELS